MPVARSTDPATSHAAADSVDHVRRSQAAVLDLLRRRGPMTDQQLADAYRDQQLPPQSPSGLRTRRHELHDTGLVEDTGRRLKLRSGRWGIVWGAAE